MDHIIVFFEQCLYHPGPDFRVVDGGSISNKGIKKLTAATGSDWRWMLVDVPGVDSYFRDDMLLDPKIEDGQIGFRVVWDGGRVCAVLPTGELRPSDVDDKNISYADVSVPVGVVEDLFIAPMAPFVTATAVR